MKSKNDIDGLKRMSAKDLDGISKWGIIDIIIPEKNCDVQEIDLSSTDVVNEYRQLLLQEKEYKICIEFLSSMPHAACERLGDIPNKGSRGTTSV